MKNKITYLISTASLFFFPLVAQAVTFKNPASGFLVDLSTKPGGENTVGGLLLYLIQLALGVAGILAVLFIIIGGFQYITSGANEELAETGKKTLTNAIIGLLIVILSYTIISIIYFSFTNTN